MDQLIAQIEASSRKKTLPEFRVGDVVRVHQLIREGGKERTQAFEGIVIAKKHGTGMGGTFTVRRIASGVGVERIFPLHAPSIAKIERLRSSKVRRAKLYFLRDLSGKKAKLKGWEAYSAWEEPSQATDDREQMTDDRSDDANTAKELKSEAAEGRDDVATQANRQPGGEAGGATSAPEGPSDSPEKS